MEMVHRRTCVYQIGYHIVFCTKYRRKALKGKAWDDCKGIFIRIAEEKGFGISKLEADKDHVHMFVSAPCRISISTLVQWIKGISARRMLQQHPELRRQFYRGHLWNPSYYVGTVGDMSEEVIKRYIESQKSKADEKAQA
jgi:putative transposase